MRTLYLYYKSTSWDLQGLQGFATEAGDVHYLSVRFSVVCFAARCTSNVEQIIINVPHRYFSTIAFAASPSVIFKKKRCFEDWFRSVAIPGWYAFCLVGCAALCTGPYEVKQSNLDCPSQSDVPRA